MANGKMSREEYAHADDVDCKGNVKLREYPLMLKLYMILLYSHLNIS